MKKYISVYHNGQRLLGTDFNRVINSGLGQRAIQNRIDSLRQSVEGLKRIKPFLLEGVIEVKVENK